MNSPDTPSTAKRPEAPALSPLTLEAAQQLYRFLQGAPLEQIQCRHAPKLSRSAAFSVIYVLQEEFHLIPDTYEKCTRCGELFDMTQGGEHVEGTERFYCDFCLS